MPFALCSMPFALYALPFALCSMPFALCSTPCALCSMRYAVLESFTAQTLYSGIPDIGSSAAFVRRLAAAAA